jgi:hypothetical protein
MSLLVDVQLVPNRILEVVKARILANRAKWLQQQKTADLKGPTRPRPQRTRFGATPTTYRRPEPGAVGSTEGVVGFQSTSPSNFDPADPQLLVGPPGVKSNETIGALCPNSALNIKERPPFYGRAYLESGGFYEDWFLLPLTKEACIAVRIKVRIFVWYHFDVTSGGFTLLDSSQDDLWEAYAFAVSKKKTRKITMPSILEGHLKELFPPMALNDTTNYRGFPFLYPTLDPYPVQTFNTPKWRDSSRYGNYSRGNETLPVAFGIGELNGFHGGNLGSLNRSEFFSPAVYQFLTGPMTVSNDSRNYQYMRETYFQNAPNYYLSQCHLDNTCDDTKIGFDVTREQPIDIITPVRDEAFRQKGAYDVKLNGADKNLDFLYYAWNWDKPAYCQQQAISLGFTAADLRP